jgi:hypothetical protein
MLGADIYLWDVHNMGSANSMGSYIMHGFLWSVLLYLGLSTEVVQMIMNVFLFIVSGITAFYLSKTVYPNLRLAPFITSIFYMFNFFVIQSVLNLGFRCTYAFLPLSIALLINIVESTLQKNDKRTNKNIIYFAVASTITFSLGSVNLANVIITLLVVTFFLLYYIIKQRNQIRLLSLNIIKLAALTVLLNIWWVVPTLNFYLWSSSELTPQINVTAWSWTHARASFLNLFWLNGGWGWRPEYVPYIDSYSNPILVILTFLPFILAATALLFRTSKSLFNAYLMLVALIFLFLAKGVHEPLSQLNLLLYTYIYGMNMFREAATKFTLALIPFLALLVGYAVHQIANRIPSKHIPVIAAKTMVVTFFVSAFVIGAYPLVTNPIETKTAQIPFSSYVKIPDYWYAATDWLNNQEGDYRVLVTPPDDFYMMPYIWGYFGTDGWITRFIQKPVIAYYFGYTIKNDVFDTIDYLYSTIKYSKASEFKAFLDLLNIKYILQRNDIYLNLTGRKIIPPDEMQTFLAQQPYLRLVKKFEQLDIYEYTTPKSYIYVLNPSTLEQARIKIEKITKLEGTWNFASLSEVEEWKNATRPEQWQITYTITYNNSTLKAELGNSTWGWKTINSPFIPAQYGSTYQIQLDIKGQNAHQVHVKTIEFDENKSYLTGTYSKFVNDGTFNWQHISYIYKPINKTTKNLQIQIWHGHETDKPLPNVIWVDNVQIASHTTFLNTTGLNLIFQNTILEQPAIIIDYTKVNPTKITATINATKPFILAISEALDQSWTAHINGKQYKPTPLYLCIKGFQINQTGLLKVTIEYEPQNWFYLGCTVSLTTFFLCVAYLTITCVKSKSILRKLNKN